MGRHRSTARTRRATAGLLLAALAALASCSRAGEGDARNLLLISIDTCRPDRLGCYGAAGDTTPNLDALARGGVLFEAAGTTTPITLPSHASILTGLWPAQHGAHDNHEHVAAGVETLAERLRAAGWRTAAFVSAFVLDARFGLDQGFERYDDELGGPGDEARWWLVNERGGADTTRAALDWLEQRPAGRFFLFLHYYDAHAPYAPAEPFASRFAGDPYAGEIAGVDAQIGRVLERLEALGLADETAVVVTSDHGESLGEHGERSHAYFAYESTIHVPLIVRAPGARAGARVGEPVSVVDLAPTLLALAGLEPTPGQVGRDLSPLLSGEGTLGERALYCESLYPTKFDCAGLRGLRRGRWKYLWTAEPELYDLGDDPAEARDVHADRPELASALHADLMRLLERSGAPARDGAAPADAEGLARVQALGYAGGLVDTSLELAPDALDPKAFLDDYNRFLDVYLMLGEERLDEAAATCADLLRRRPGLLEVREVLARVQARQGAHADAVETCQAFLAAARARRGDELPAGRHALDPAIGRVLVELGDAQRALGRRPAAVQSYQRAAQSLPDSPAPWSALGDLLAQDLSRWKEAVDAYTAALEREPDSAVVHNNLANCHAALGQLAEAERHYRAALALSPDDEAARVGLERTLQRRR